MNRAIMLTGLVVLSGAAAADDAAIGSAADNQPLYTRNIGPLKLSAGVVDSNIRLGVDGKYNYDFEKYSWSCPWGPINSTTIKGCFISDFIGAAKIDSSWKSGSASNNYAELNLNVAFLQEYSTFKFQSPVQRGQKNCGGGGGGAGGLAGADISGCDDSYRGNGYGYTLYPEVGYRYGRFSQSGKTFDANQTYYGAGTKFFFAEKEHKNLPEDPYVSVSYDDIHNSGGTNAPAPAGIQARYLVTEGYVNVYLPTSKWLDTAILDRVKGKDSGCRPAPGQLFAVSAKITGSHPMSGGGWQVAHEYKLVMQLGQDLTPLLSYKTGEDRGFTYDRQVLLGFAYSFLGGTQEAKGAGGCGGAAPSAAPKT